MKNVSLRIAIIAGIVALGIAGYLLLVERTLTVPEVAEEPAAPLHTYASPAYGLTFTYSSDYYLKERNAGTNERPQLSIVLVEDTQENRDVIEGRTTEPREGPTAITIEVYPNPDSLPAEDWVQADTNWTVRTSPAAPIGRGSLTGVTYTWSGLYEGKTVIVTEGTRAYVFSVTWMTPTDPILTEFDRLLANTEVSPN